LLPHAFLVTPNLPEAAVLAGMEVVDESSMEEAAEAIALLGPKNVLVKGGHLPGGALDLLWSDGQVHRFPSDRIESKGTHGTGCIYSAAITAGLARGDTLLSAIARAKAFVTEAIRTSPGLGHGVGPTNLHTPISTAPTPG
jgi:hydroxymethylpyrimidine kinase/phosphomethylpyrimidine kinase